MNADKLIRGYSVRKQKAANEQDDDRATRIHKPNLHEDNLLNKLLGHSLQINPNRTIRVDATRYQKALDAASR